MPAPEAQTIRPLSGVKVIDLTHVLAGPFSTYQLAILGADVIKIEEPSVGDVVRQDGVDPAQNDALYGSLFLAQNANKRCIAVDIKSDKGREIVRKLAMDADVFVENYRPGALSGIGLGYDDIRQINPRIIYCSMTGFGQSGALASRTAYDQVIQAISGLMGTTGTPEMNPLKVGAPVLDYSSGLFAAFAMTAAILQREKTGLGQHVDCAMLDAALMLMSPSITGFHLNGSVPRPRGNTLPQAASSAYPTKSGLIMVGAYNARQNERLWTLLGRPDLAKLSSIKDQGLHRDRLQAELEVILLQKSASEWEELFNRHGIPAARVRKIDETLSMEQLKSRGLIHAFPSNDGPALVVPMTAFKYAHGGPRIDTAPEKLGQSTRAVLSEMGYSADDIGALETDGVIACGPDSQTNQRIAGA